jgi:KipI family sensor histidine kinase inhibitor
VPSLGGIALHFDAARMPVAALEAARALLAECLGAARKSRAADRVVELPVCYDPEFGLDLQEICSSTRLGPSDIVKFHTSAEHRVLMVGFAPGQPYLGGLDPRLAVPRRAEPRTRVPAGSIAIANTQTAVYPFEIAGGWNVIGRTPLRVFDPGRDPPSLFAPGDRVRFVPIARRAFDALS